ncbi:MAG: endonuclease domain-containing protein [Dehalococcoidia bacterium]|nr:endonuclease domain-containing protein [Dehalococcoidia bacterium]
MNTPRLTLAARVLRRKQTDAERKLWGRLRNVQVDGAKFRRQEPVGDFITDFVCFDRKLVIEVDGGQHNEPATIDADRARTTWLESQGFRVLRFWNNDVLLNIDGVIKRIQEAVGPLPACPESKEQHEAGKQNPPPHN